MISSADKVEVGRQIVELCTGEGVTARLLGGVAVALSCPSATEPPLRRSYGDLDLVTDRRGARQLGELLERTGYTPDREFNAAQGRSRMLFHDPDGGHVDVFVETFVMCHTLELKDRLQLGALTISSSDLLLTKLQIAAINHKDVVDLSAILLDLGPGSGEREIDTDYVTALLSRDWGWWRTVTENLERLRSDASTVGLSSGAEAQLGQRVEGLTAAIESRPKSIKWRARARVGERVPWRDEPEEIAE